MNNEEQVSVWEFLKGIVNFLLAIIFVLSLSAGEFDFGLVSLLGLIIINISLLKAYFTGKKQAKQLPFKRIIFD
ncbi:MAG: hypothetical protein GY950_00180 [bacterium]|nr:hypothetical protein [bacterium]